MFNPDIDIDTKTSFDPISVFNDWVLASMITNGELKKHPVGIHPQTIPKDPITGLSSIPYKEAEERGIFKVDFLHLQLYDFVTDRKQMMELLDQEPQWDLLMSPSIVESLFQLGKHFDIIQEVKPRCLEEIADVLALIRPGKKRLLKLYLKNKVGARKYLYDNDGDQYSFKKSHSFAYALVVKLQLVLITKGIIT